MLNPLMFMMFVPVSSVVAEIDHSIPYGPVHTDVLSAVLTKSYGRCTDLQRETGDRRESAHTPTRNGHATRPDSRIDPDRGVVRRLRTATSRTDQGSRGESHARRGGAARIARRGPRG